MRFLMSDDEYFETKTTMIKRNDFPPTTAVRCVDVVEYWVYEQKW